jgi:arginase family enzyme
MNLFANKWTFLDLPYLPAKKHGKIVGDIGILGIPFDGVASYRTGQREAPMVLRASSIALIDGSPAFANVDLKENLVCLDLGDVETAIGDTKIAHKNIVRAYTRARKNLKQLVVMGGKKTQSTGCGCTF